jgi:selenide, water dikinase
LPFDANVIVGLDGRDDAGVYRLTDDLAIIQTIDYFTPIVDDPYDFGQIAAANALSDVYAMGGRPVTAMNVVCFPRETMNISVLREILRGGIAKLSEAGASLVGGHSVDDRELKYGLSVMGTVHPDRVITNTGAREGDVLILTKPLGTGIISTAMKSGVAKQEIITLVTRQMATLNRRAAELMADFNVHACTDITGFGLLGHACEMVQGTGVGMEVDSQAVPILPGVNEYCRQGLVPGGTRRNREFRSDMIEARVSEDMVIILFDAQTSGGLLLSLPPADGETLVEKMHHEGIKDAAIVGRVVANPEEHILIR